MTIKLRRAGFACVLASAAAVAASPASSFAIDGLVVFGDSNVDIGRLAVEGAGDLNDGELPPPNTVGGRSSDGTILPEFLAQRLNVPQLNFGWGGATSGDDNIVSAFGYVDAALTGTLSQIDEYEMILDGGAPDADTLFFVFAGSNDLFNADKNDQAAVDAAVASADANLREAVTRLSDLGAKNIVVATRTPRPVLSEADSVADEADPDARNDASGRQLNIAIRSLAAELNASLPAGVILFDVDAIIRGIIDESESYGFLAYSDDPEQYCVSGVYDCAELINYDGAHKTSAVHSLLADAFIDQLELSRVPLPPAAGLMLVGLGGFAVLRRRRAHA